MKKKTLVNLTPLDLTDHLPLPIVLPPNRTGRLQSDGRIDFQDIEEAADLLSAVPSDWTCV